MRRYSWAFLSVLLTAASVHADPADSVVKVTARTHFPHPTTPWSRGKGIEGYGTGIILDGKRILTNAHVVLYASDIHVQQRPGGDKVEAKIEFIARDMDLALLTLKDERFFDNKPPMKRTARLPKVRDAVTVFGYPVGGDDLSITKGEVSRINTKYYGDQGVGVDIQISAAVNPGNSGGPAVVGDTMIGVVYSQLREGQNIGYIIPGEEVEYFLEDIKDGKYDGKPRENTPTSYQHLENEGLRRMLKVDDKVKGVMVVNPSPGFPLQEYDIITKVGPHTIDNTGLVEREAGLRVPWLAMVPKLAKDGSVPVTIIRAGKTMAATVPAYQKDHHLLKRYEGEPLPYFIHGTMVFVPARSEDVSLYQTLNPRVAYFASPLLLRQNAHAAFPDEELVVVSAAFSHKVTKGYHFPVSQVVKDINGTPIKNLRHLVETLRDCKEEFLKIRFAESHSAIFVLPRQEFDAATADVLEENNILPSRRGSAELLEVWKGKKKE